MTKLSPPKKQKIVIIFFFQQMRQCNKFSFHNIKQKPSLIVCNPLPPILLTSKNLHFYMYSYMYIYTCVKLVMDSDLTCPQLSPYNSIQHASRGEVGAQCEMGRKKGILSLLPTTSKNAQHRTRWECRVTLHHAVCCMKMTADKSGLRLQIIYFILSLSTWITHLL